MVPVSSIPLIAQSLHGGFSGREERLTDAEDLNCHLRYSQACHES